MTEVTKPKPNKKPPRLYRVALVSEDLRFKLAEAVTGNCQRFLIGSKGEWHLTDFVLSDQAVRYHIKNLSGDAWIDGKADARWPELLEELINEPAQIEWRAENLRIARERAAAKRAERRAA